MRAAVQLCTTLSPGHCEDIAEISQVAAMVPGHAGAWLCLCCAQGKVWGSSTCTLAVSRQQTGCGCNPAEGPAPCLGTTCPPAAQGQCECRAIHPQQHRPKTIYLCFPSTALWVECKQVQPQAGAAREGGAWSIPLLLAMSQSCHPRDIHGEDSAGLSGCSPCFCGPDALQPCTRAWVDGEKVSAQPFSP